MIQLQIQNYLRMILLFSLSFKISTATDLKSDLSKISDWAFQWKIKFNSDPNKQAQEVN